MKNLILEKKSNSVAETFSIAENFINSLENKDCLIILSGTLGAGKTHFTKGIFKAMGYKNYEDITSPTFDLVNTYNVPGLIIHHLDLYRLDKLDSEDWLWLEELLSENSLSVIEWGDKFTFNLNKKIYYIVIEILNENERQIKIFTN
jgi:tRNA threonylcarbamoyladenosine biosynthesis protein TsaE